MRSLSFPNNLNQNIMKKYWIFIITLFAGSLAAQQADLNGTIASSIDAADMEGVEVELRDAQDNTVDMVTTGANGQYAFTGLQPGEYRLYLKKSGSPLEYISTFDAVLVARHVLGVAQFSSPVSYLGADVNHSGTITTYDIALMRRMILGIDTNFPDGDAIGSWRFIPQGWIPQNPNNPLPELSGNYFPVQLNAGANTFNWTGIKIGNVN